MRFHIVNVYDLDLELFQFHFVFNICICIYFVQEGSILNFYSWEEIELTEEEEGFLPSLVFIEFI